MARRYDSRTTIFSPEGRLYQVEYAMEAISHAGACLGLLSTDGVVLAAEKKVSSKLLDVSAHSEKMYEVDDNLVVAVAGITADANILVNEARLMAQRHVYRYQEPMQVEMLVQQICDLKQGYTQYGGLRPFGVSFLYAGWDKNYGFQLFQSDPSGNYGGWKATAIGANYQSAQGVLKQEYDEPADMPTTLALSIKVLAKTMDSTSLKSDKLEISTLTMEDGRLKARMLEGDEIDVLIEAYEAEVKAEQEEADRLAKEKERERKKKAAEAAASSS